MHHLHSDPAIQELPESDSCLQTAAKHWRQTFWEKPAITRVQPVVQMAKSGMIRTDSHSGARTRESPKRIDVTKNDNLQYLDDDGGSS